MSLALTKSSPALDAGSCTDNTAVRVEVDQCGLPHPSGASCDIGAFELQPVFLNLLRARSEEPGSRCATGGTAIEQGADLDENGELSDDEVTSTPTFAMVRPVRPVRMAQMERTVCPARPR